MKFEIRTTGHPVTPPEIAAYEAGSRAKLPPQFAAFIQRYNGGQPTVMLNPINDIDSGLSEFLPLFEFPKTKKYYTGLVHVSGDLLCFAYDNGGGVFGIAHTGQNFGKVFWIDRPHCDIEHPSSQDCTLMATSFDAFLNSLEPCID